MAFSVSHLRGADPTLDTLVQMERKEFCKKQELQSQPCQQSSRSLDNSLVIYSGKEPLYPFCTVSDKYLYRKYLWISNWGIRSFVR
jgi:hypothetical protein